MGLKYKEDKYLEFLQDQDNDKLEVLVKSLMYDVDGKKRKLEELSATKEYKDYQPNHRKYWHLIVADYKKFAGNTIINITRSSGIPYEEILRDVCEQLKIKFDKNIQVSDLERKLLLQVMEDMFQNNTKIYREAFLKDLGIEADNLTDQAVMLALKTALNNRHFFDIFSSHVVSPTLDTAFMLLNPTLYAVAKLSGPAYKVTIPMTVYIAALRQAELNKNNFDINCPHCNSVITNRKISTCKNCGGEYR